MASAYPNCDIYQKRNILKPVVKWCCECKQSICSDCDEHHSLSKATRNHQTISINDYQNLPSAALNIKYYCEDHDEKLDFYCPIHTDVCCVKCVELSHHECREIKSLRDVIKDIKSSAVVIQHENTLAELCALFKSIKNDKVENSRYIDQQTSYIKEKILKLRREVNSHLDKLEKDILSSLESNKSKFEDKISNFTSLLDDKTTRIESTIDNITKYKQYASDLQTFLGLPIIEKTIEEEKEFISLLESRSDFQNFEIHFDVSPAFESILTGVTSLGSVKIETKNTPGEFTLTSDKQAQVQIPNQTQEIEDIDKVTLTKIVDINIKADSDFRGHRITGCEILDNNNILLANTRGRELLMYTDQGVFTKKFELSFTPLDICSIMDEKIAISSASPYIYIFDMELKKTINQTNTTKSSFGLEVFDGKIFCRISQVGIKVFSLTLEPISEIKIVSSSTLHISLAAGRMYYPDEKAKYVLCCDMDGKEIWKFYSSCTRGISCSRNGFVFVTDYGASEVSLISRDGTKVRLLLAKQDGMNGPACIRFRNQNNHLLLCNETDGRVFMYKVNVL